MSASSFSRPNFLRNLSNSSHSQDGPLLEYLLDFLADDERPTFIIQTAEPGLEEVPAPTPRVVFENAAFTALFEQYDYRSSFEDWLRPLSTEGSSLNCTTTHIFGGRVWSSKCIQNGWRVIYSSYTEQYELEKQQSSTEGAEGIHGICVTLTNESLELERVTSSRSMTVSRKRTMSDLHGRFNQQESAWKDVDEYGNRRSIDWTRGFKHTSNPWIRFLQEYSWERTRIGPLATWPDELRSMAVFIMSNTEPRMIYWGEDKLMLYNEAAAVVIGQPHPTEALGNPFADVWGTEILARQMDMISRAIFDDRAVQALDFEAILERRGFSEETYWRLKFLPMVGHEGFAVGAVNEYTESTYSVYGDQRRKLITRLGDSLAVTESLPELWSTFLTQLEDQLYDISYALAYSRENPNDSSSTASTPSLQNSYRLEGTVGVERSAFQETLGLDQDDDELRLIYNIIKAQESRQTVVLSTDVSSLPSGLAISILDRGTVRNVCILPIASFSGQEMGAIILGMNPKRFFDDDVRVFVDGVRDLVVKSAAIISLPEEQRRQRQFEEMNVALSQQLRITALKAEKNEETFVRMAQNAPFGMYMYSSDGSPKYFNDAYLKLIGLSRQTLLDEAEGGLAWRNTVFEDDLDFVLRAWQGLTVAKTPTKLEYRVKVPPKRPGDAMTTKHLEAISFPELDENGMVVTIQGWLTDISHRKLSENLMAQRLQDALETKRASTRFIDMVSHEMRNPLSAILQLADGILNLLEVPAEGETINLSAETADHIIDSAQTVMLCAQHQKTIIDDVLTISKLDSNLLVISPDRVKAESIIKQSLKMYEAELERADIEASIEVDKSYDDLNIDWVMLDPSRLLQVIINLLTNAIKFTRDSETRRITVFLSAFKTPPTGADHGLEYIEQRQTVNKTTSLPTAPEWGPGEEVYLEFAVTDTGKGLSEDELKLLFHRFAQASPKTYKQYGGSGLGLFISRELTELQGGKIGAIGKAGEGCTFAFYVKARRCPDAPSRRASELHRPSISHTGSGSKVATQANGSIRMTRTISGSSVSSNTKTSLSDLHILIVEDNKINQKVMSAQLKRLGCTVHTADHGLDALAFLSTTVFFHSQDRVPLSLVLMDLEMPVMDGLTCVRRIRQLERTEEIITHVPIIAITANARREQIETALEAGMDDVVTKPFRIPDLVPRMQALVSRTTAVD